jgi:hypothetical protein
MRVDAPTTYENYFDGGVQPNTPFVSLFLSNRAGVAEELPLLDAKRTIGSDVNDSTSGTALYLLSFSYNRTNKIALANDVTIRILDPNYDYLTSKLFRDGQSTREQFFFNYGWRGIDDMAQGYRQIPFYIWDLSIHVDPLRGSEVELRGMDVASANLSKHPITTFVGAETDITDAIRKVVGIASGNTVDLVMERMNKPVGERHNRCENMTALAYIQSLLKYAVSNTGQSEFIAYVSASRAQGRISYHIEPIGTLQPLKKTYIYGRDRTGEMMSLDVTMNDQTLALLGGTNVTASYVNPKTKKAEYVTSTQSESPADGERYPTRTSQKPEVNGNSPLSREETEGEAKSTRAMVSRGGWNASATVRGDTKLVPRDKVGVIVLKSDPSGVNQGVTQQDIHKFPSGVYRIWEITDTITGGAFTTSLVMTRNSAYDGHGEDTNNYIREDLIPKSRPETVEAEITALENPDYSGRRSNSTTIFPDPS